MTASPSDSKKELTGALVRAVIAAALTVALFIYSGQVAPEKTTFYRILATISVIVFVVHSVRAWTLYNKSKP